MSDSDNNKTIVLGGAAAAPASPPPTPPRGTGSDVALPPGTRLSEFEIVDLVGQGGFGIVYLADDHSLQRRVAVKEYMPSSLATRGRDASVIVRSERHEDTFQVGLRSFVNEARLLAQFDHPALLKVYRFWEANGTAYMAMPYYAGKTLKQALKDRAGQPPDEAWIRKILSPVMDALELMHHENCFHRDVAPDNIMLLRDDRPVLLDFGAARRVISDMTQALTVILKPGYAPIEQYAEMPGIKQGPWTDIYALGAVVYFTITGRTPPPAVGRMMQDSYEPLASLAAGRYSARFLEGIDTCLHVKGDERPQSIAEMRALLGPGEAAATLYVAPESPDTTDSTAPADSPAADLGTRILTTAYMPAASPAEPAPQASAPGTPSAPHTPAKAPPPATGTPSGRSRLPLYAGGLAAVVAIAVGAYLSLQKEAPPAASVTKAEPPPAAPAAAPAPPPAAPIVAAPRQAEAQPLAQALAAVVAGSDSAFSLKVDKIRTPLTIGRDALSFSLSSQRSGLLYVLLWDKASGRLAQIFPNDLDRQNKVVAGKPFSFPRPDWAYEADPPQGDWEVLTLVSESPRDFSTLGLTAHQAGDSLPQASVEAALGKAGGGAALAGEARCPDGGACPAAYAALRFNVAEAAPAERKPPAAKASPPREPRSQPKDDGTEADRKYVEDLNKTLDRMLKEK